MRVKHALLPNLSGLTNLILEGILTIKIMKIVRTVRKWARVQKILVIMYYVLQKQYKNRNTSIKLLQRQQKYAGTLLNTNVEK